MPGGQNRCEYVIRRAGETVDGRPAMLDGYGDTTQTCGKFGRPVPHTFWVKRPMSVHSDPVEGTVIRCPEHEEIA